MSTAERTRLRKILPPLVAGQRLDQPTFHQRYEAMPPGTHAELVGGMVYMPSPMRLDHGTTSWRLNGWMEQYIRSTPGIEGAGAATVKLDDAGEPQPDGFLFIPKPLGGQTDIDDEGYLTGPPELVAEVSRSTRYFDLNNKKADYERAGVREYIVVELDPDQVHWFILRDRHFEDLPPGPDGIYRSEVFPGLWLDPRALFAQDRDRLYRVLRQGIRSAEHAEFAARMAPTRRKRRRP